MLVQDYPVSTPYGYVPGYPLNNGFHSGIDYSCPDGTPVIVNGVSIGISNNTGASTGAHCHVGKYVNGVVQDPGVGNGFSFDSAIVYDTGEDDVNGIYVRITGDGALWNYLHLEKVLVTKGQVLKEVAMFNEADRQNLNVAFWGKDEGRLKSLVLKTYHDAMYELTREGDDPDLFMFHFKVNNGDLPGVALVVGDKAPEMLKQDWKTAGQFMEANMQVPGFTPIPGQAYTKDS